LKHLIVIAIVSVAIAAFVVTAPANAAPSGHSPEKVPIIGLVSIGFGDRAFSEVESFHIHPGSPIVQRTSHILNLSYTGRMVSPINDSIEFNDSIDLTTNPLSEVFLVGNGTYELSVPPGRAYLNSIAITGSTSYTYATIVEDVPTQDILLNRLPVNSTVSNENHGMYNLTLEYGNSSFVLYSPALLRIGGALSQVSLKVEGEAKGGNSYLSFSFPVNEGSFSVAFEQVLSSEQPISSDVMSYFQISGFSSPLEQHLISNSISLGIGASLFVVVVLGLFLYYRKK
jgi:hypothetical protein